MIRPLEIAVVQLPIDLQNEIRRGVGSFATGAIGSRARETLLLAILVATTAAAMYGVASASSELSEAFLVPWRWLALLLGATIAGAILGEHARLDIRPHGITTWIVGTTSLVQVERDLVRVYPAELLVHTGSELRLRGEQGELIVGKASVVPAAEELAAAQRVAADPLARDADRWRAAAIGRPAPIRRWTPAWHGAGLGLALAVAIEAIVPNPVSPWDALQARVAQLDAPMARKRHERIAAASAEGPAGLFALVADARHEDNKALVRDAVTAAVAMVLARRADARLDDLLMACRLAIHDMPEASCASIASVYGDRLVAEAPTMPLAELGQRIGEAVRLKVSWSVYSSLDEVLAGRIAASEDTENLALIQDLYRLGANRGGWPRTAQKIDQFREQLFERGKQGDLAVARRAVAQLEQVGDVAAADEVRARVASLCEAALPPAKLGRDLAGHLAAVLCPLSSSTVCVVPDDPAEQIASQYAERATEVLRSIGDSRVIAIGTGCADQARQRDKAVLFLNPINEDQRHPMIMLDSANPLTAFVCSIVPEGRWSCVQQDSP